MGSHVIHVLEGPKVELFEHVIAVHGWSPVLVDPGSQVLAASSRLTCCAAAALVDKKTHITAMVMWTIFIFPIPYAFKTGGKPS